MTIFCFSRGHWKGERFYQAKHLRNEVSNGVKWAVAQLVIDLKQVSSRSWQKGAINSLVAHGQSDEVVRHLTMLWVVRLRFFTNMRRDKRRDLYCSLHEKVVS